MPSFTHEPRSFPEYEVQGAQASSTPLSLIDTDMIEANIAPALQMTKRQTAHYIP